MSAVGLRGARLRVPRELRLRDLRPRSVRRLPTGWLGLAGLGGRLLCVPGVLALVRLFRGHWGCSGGWPCGSSGDGGFVGVWLMLFLGSAAQGRLLSGGRADGRGGPEAGDRHDLTRGVLAVARCEF
ncbi:hypothetical protein BJF83_02555 [Nocardiopsis sp. CNR-923]|nr:hypothetical protein BJF83_02555 [Nocardiopsis sp. CNR-923]